MLKIHLYLIFYLLLVGMLLQPATVSAQFEQADSLLADATLQKGGILRVQNLLTQAQNISESKEAIVYLKEALEIAEKEAYDPGKLGAHDQLADLYVREGNYSQAIVHLEAGISMAQRLGEVDILLRIYERLERSYREQKDLRKVAEYSRKYAALQESVLKQEADDLQKISERQLADLEAKWKSGEIDSLRMQQQKDSLKVVFAMQEESTRRRQAEFGQLKAEIINEEVGLSLAESRKHESRANRYLLITIPLLLLAVILAAWQRYKYLQQRDRAEIESLRALRQKQADRLKDQFLTHTLRKLHPPMKELKLLTNALLKRENKTDEFQGQVETLAASATRMNHVLNDFADFSRLKNAELKLETAPQNLQQAVAAVLQACQPMVQGKSVQLHNKITKDLPRVKADETRLGQILHNLVENAIRFTQKGTVSLSAAQKDKLIEVTVADTGTGIATKDQEAIFTAFNQVDGSISTAYKGKGLGLAMTRNLVRLHGGEIRVESKPGKGARFIFTLPQA